ncbi:PREDICTED: probable aspartyl aminopeptidase isoform X2 [Nicotiana attenuata]|uniref:probable aspartyl aminopeptidase isoform X2 n=1 Tax=Nicotiana attenuata TaxID=49451 RepID=UPI000905D299|nr:PREDICTED: probable aspartyl aminopeptidase isoform X2 [Nicotiana attenuata]
MAANAIARFHFLQPYPVFPKPSVLLSKFPQSPPFSINVHNINNPCRIHFRKFSSVTSPLCSTSGSIPESAESSESSTSIVGDLLDYLNESWTQFHATAEAKRQLIAAGFHLLKENEKWDLQPGGRYFFTRNMSSLVAFAIGKKLVKITRPLLRVPTLAIHLNRTVNQDGFKPNLETQLIPLLATKTENATADSTEKSNVSSSKDVHHQLLLQILSDELSCKIDDIVSVELNLCDTQPSCLGGANNEFIFSGRLDNLASSFCGLRALVDSCTLPEDLSNEHAIRMIALFDNEEVGSDSYQGAGAPTMFEAMRRITDCLSHQSAGESDFARAIRHSFLVSADMAHGVHPNFVDKHEEHHRPELQKGLVIKHNANQRYATSGVTSFLFKEVARLHSLPTQDFVVRNDMGCGSTIGPILASGVGIRTVDCGIAQLSMHSVREICGKEDIDIAYKHFKAFYQTFSSIDRKLIVD